MYSFYSHSYAPSWGILGIGAIGLIIGLILLVIVIAIKGLALWHAAKRNERWWFIAMLVINTAGILELVYLIAFVKVKWRDLKLGCCKDCSSCNNGDATNTNTPKQ
jgi:methionyl-tRNA synthetase